MPENTQIDAKKLSEAKVVYNTLCATLDNMKWNYNKDEEKLIIRTSAVGDDLSMKLYIKVDAERSVMYLKSGMPFSVPKEKIDDMMNAVIIANWAMLNGSFEMDRSDGYTAFKVVIPFMESMISEKVCHYMINLSCRMIDKFNDKFLAVVENRMTVAEFEDFAKKAFS